MQNMQREELLMFGKHNQSKVRYINYQYPEDHWAVSPTKEGTGLALFTFRGKYRYLAKLNPTDSRGYRLLVAYLGKIGDHISTTFNRDYTSEEQIGLLDVTSLLITIYKKLGILVHCAQAGNNVHKFDSKLKIISIGTHKEPAILHMHIFGRGDTKREYIPGIPLDGPELGLIFDMRGATANVPGNCEKVKWEPKHLQLALDAIKQSLFDYSKTNDYTNEFGQSIAIDILPPHLTPSFVVPEFKNQHDSIKMFELANYSGDHWAFNPTKGGFLVAYFTVSNQYQYIVQLNQDDSRGNRLLVTYIGEKNKDIRSSFKLFYDTTEQKGLFTIAALMISIYKMIGFPIVQVIQHGNNSQAFDHSSRTILLGNEKEPSRLLLHIIGRGCPQEDYISHVPLEGPVPGEIFDTRATMKNVPGNQEKLKWSALSQSECITTIRQALAEYSLSDEYFREFSHLITWRNPTSLQNEYQLFSPCDQLAETKKEEIPFTHCWCSLL
jgi:hypothetical protein